MATAKPDAARRATKTGTSTLTLDDDHNIVGSPGTATTGGRDDDDDDGDGDRDDAPFIGEVIAGKYRVDRVLGAGGMGVVVAVTHMQLGEPYAIKLLRKKHARDATTVVRFMREARAAARIKSEHVARVSDVGQLPNSGAPFFLMEYLTGSDLATVLEADGALPPSEAVEYILQACAGIAETHALGFVHRDIKPSNLFLTERSDGTPLVKVLDFGIAKALDETATGPQHPNLTETAAAFGSPSYMSPEQVRSARSVDFRADIWALGVVLYELLASTRPFHGETPFATLAAIMADEPRSLRLLKPDVSAELEAVILRCLKKDASERFQSVAELAEALAPFARQGVVSMGRIKRLDRGSAAVAARTFASGFPGATTNGSRLREALKRNRTTLIVIAVAALAVATIAIVRMPEPRVIVTPSPATPATDIAVSSSSSAATSSSAAPAGAVTSSRAPTYRSPHAPKATKPPSASPAPPPPAPTPTRDPTAESH